MRLPIALACLLFAATAAGSTAVASNDGDHVRLSGYQEDPFVLSTPGTGTFIARIDDSKQEITYRLSYRALEGRVLQGHLHFGGAAQSGGILVFLCTNLNNGPAGTQTCPAAPATITGTLRPVDIVGPAGQGIVAPEFDELARAMRAGAVYVNVHSEKYPGGEIRGQLGHRH